MFAITWSDGLLVEAAVAVAETNGHNIVPGYGQIHFVSDLSADDRNVILAESATSSHTEAPALRAAIAQAADGLDALSFQPLNQLSI